MTNTRRVIALLEEKAAKTAECDACGALSEDLQAATFYGVEGSFCHECRHGKDCECGESEEAAHGH